MAYKLMLAGSPFGMPFIWNVSKHVGPAKAHPNQATDVELVQILLAESIKRGWPDEAASSGVGAPPVTVDGKFNSVLGFWIFYAQRYDGPSSATVDGVVSPAHGMMYGGAPWVIAKLNNFLRFKDFNTWSKLDSDTRLSMELRSELKTTSP